MSGEVCETEHGAFVTNPFVMKLFAINAFVMNASLTTCHPERSEGSMRLADCADAECATQRPRKVVAASGLRSGRLFDSAVLREREAAIVVRATGVDDCGVRSVRMSEVFGIPRFENRETWGTRHVCVEQEVAGAPKPNA